VAVALASAVLPGAAVANVVSTPASEACPVVEVEFNVAYDCQFEFEVPSSNGYRISVVAEPGHSGAEIKTSGRAGEATYITKNGKSTATSINASFGKFGKVSMQFRPSGHPRKRNLSKKCDPNRPASVSSQPGEFVGTFRFRGERGYTHVIANRVRGALGDPLTNEATRPIRCEFHESAAERKRELGSVSLDVNSRHPNVSFSAGEVIGNFRSTVGASSSRPILFLASSFERSGALSIFRLAGAIGAPSVFSFDQALTQATVTPPAPFAGSGHFRRSPTGEPEWSGSLSVALPGLGRVALSRGKAELATVADHLKHFEEELEAPHPPSH
jgi:hypothetical protein